MAELLDHQQEVVVIDNLSLGHIEAINVLKVPFYQVDIRDQERVYTILKEHQVDTVIHFAAYSQVGESVSAPLKYYQNNVAGTADLLSAMAKAGVHRLVFSSTCATYGEPQKIPMTESLPTQPTNPYGESKLAIERMLHWCQQAYGLSSVSLRYFNAAGAHPTLPIGEHHNPESHLIPLVLMTAQGIRDKITVNGTDYPTEDGSCIRDYIHVMDLASAHRLAVERLHARPVTVEVYNLGIGKGYSVLEVIEAARQVTKREIPVDLGSRRAGDPAVLVASSELAQRVLGWRPLFTDLSTIIETAWMWHQAHPNGFSN